MFTRYSWLLAFASCLLFSACEKNPVDTATNKDFEPTTVAERSTLHFGLSAKEIGETQLSFNAVSSKDVVLYHVKITNPLGKTIVFKMGSELCLSGQRVPLQHPGESYAKHEGLYKFEFQGRRSEGGELSGAFTSTASYPQP